MAKKIHIDDVQPATIDEHERLLIEDRSSIDTEFTEVTAADLPEWFNERMFKAGQSFYMRNLMGAGMAAVIGLVAILAVPDILKILIFTKQSGTKCSAYRRYIQTLLHIYSLYNNNVTDPSSTWYKSLNIIRWKHSTVNKRSQKSQLSGIYQKDMAITQFGFIGYVLIEPKALGLSHTREEVEGFNHFWRVTGHMLGISDRINICRKTPEETRELCSRIAYNIIAKYMDDASPDFLKMSTIALNGLWYADFIADADAILCFTHKLTKSEYKKKLSRYSQLNMMYRSNLLYLCTVPYIGAIVRTGYNYFLMFSYWMLQNFPVFPWITLGKTESRICLYPKLT